MCSACYVVKKRDEHENELGGRDRPGRNCSRAPRVLRSRSEEHGRARSAHAGRLREGAAKEKKRMGRPRKPKGPKKARVELAPPAEEEQEETKKRGRPRRAKAGPCVHCGEEITEDDFRFGRADRDSKGVVWHLRGFCKAD